MLPTAQKRLLCAASAALACLLSAGPATAAPAPKIKAAYTADSDRDGHVDAVSVKWSAEVRGGRDRRAPFAFSVKGYRVTGVAPARGRSQRISLAERRECDAGGSVRVGYSGPRKGPLVEPRKGTKRIKRHSVDMRRFDPPVPRITCAITLDADGDSQVDGIRLTYSRAVRSREQRSGRFLFSVAGYRIKVVRAAKGRFLQIDLVERGAADSGAKPVVSYARPARRSQRPYAVRAGRRGTAFSGSFLSTRDGVAPRLMAGRTADTDRDGLLDAMTVRFSEPIDQAAPSGLGVLGMPIRSLARNGGNLSLTLAEGSARTDARPGTWVGAGGVSDLAGNPSLRGAITPADGAQPVMTAAVTADSGGAPGRLDTVLVGFSEPVAHARDGGGTYPFFVSGRRLASVEPSAGRAVPLKLVEATTPDTGEKPPVRLIPGAGLPVKDLAGNDAAEGFVNALDAVAPVLLSGVTADADADGRIDAVTLSFSEPLQHGAEPAPSFAIAGYSPTEAGPAQGPDIRVAVDEGAAGDSGATPAINYARDGVEDVRDAAGNATPNSTLAAAQDGAAPVLVSARTADSDDDGRLDALVTDWSEPLDHADDQSAPFPVSAAGADVSRVRGAAGQSLTIDLVEPSESDTGSTPALTYSGGADPIRDAAGFEPQTRTWNDLTVDALPPRLVSATTADADEDGSLDAISLRYSEAVVHPDENAPASFVVAGLTVTSAEAASGSALDLTIQEAGANSGLRPAVSYAPDGQDDVRDESANPAGAATLAQATDGARPVMTSAATRDTDDDGRLDRVATTWSEALDHTGASAAPFPVSVEQLNVARTNATATNALDIDLAEPNSPDTGSAPDVTYAGAAVPIRDSSGLEAGQRAYPGLTRDALAPRLVSAGTDDADADGRLDGVVFEWSEQVTGATSTAPFTVAGRAVAANAVFTGPRTRVPFAEDAGQFDTHHTPDVSYNDAPGDLRDIVEGAGDTAEDAPAVSTRTPLDRAAPILVAARTADLTTPPATNDPNGTIDAVLTTFSEPISHNADGLAPFSLNVGGRTEQDIEADTGPGDRTLYVRVNETSAPDGGEKPNVSVAAVGPVADRVRDRAAVPNEARPMNFTGTTDEVRPVLMSAQLGERAGGACTKSPVAGIDGEVDCVLATWSEEVELAADASGPYSVQSSVWNVAAGGIAQLPPSKTLEIPFAASGTKDRDRSGTTVSYDEAIDMPVMDVASPPNESLSGSRIADSACRDTGLEGNDSQAADNPTLATTAPSFQRKCAFDDDWYKVETAAGAADSGFIEMVTRPSVGIDVDFKLYDAAGVEVPATETLETGAAGKVDRRRFTGLVPATAYHVRVTADETTAPQEGPYCVVFSSDPAAEPGCGPLVGQIVFTEVGFGNDKFLEIKNDFDVPVEMEGAGAELILGPVASSRRCTLTLPTNPVNSVIDPNEHVLVLPTPTATAFGCDKIPSLSATGERLELSASGSIDVVDFDSIVNSPIAAGHSLQFVEDDLTEDADANNDVAGRWCRTYAADSKGAVGDGCDEYRINEVLWKPTATSADANGKAFVEIAGNIPALANSQLLGNWIVRGVNGTTGEGTDDFVLPANASPRTNGTYVIADGASGVTQVSTSDSIWDGLDLSSPQWPDGTGTLGPRGIQLMRPSQAGNAPCTGSADAFGWVTAAEPFNLVLDNLRSCPTVEPAPYAVGTHAVSAARDNLATAAAQSYNAANDTNNNNADFCAQPPNPGQLNTGRSC